MRIGLIAFLLGMAVCQAEVISVVDESGAAVAGARISVRSAQQIVLAEAITNTAGQAEIGEFPQGLYAVEVNAPGFAARSLPFRPGSELRVTLSPAAVAAQVTVTASRGAAESEDAAIRLVSILDKANLDSRPLPTLGNALQDAPGVLVQQTTYGQVSPFLRGLTGYHVLNLIDGVRFNNSTFRSGPNQYLAFVEPSQVQQLEAVLGPVGADYGSDALGGAIHVLTRSPGFSVNGLEKHGDVNLFAGSADQSAGANAQLSLSGERMLALIGGTGRRLGDLRAGRGLDSRNVFHRLFGMDQSAVQDLLGSRLHDTGFTQYGMHSRFALRLPDSGHMTVWYQNSTQQDVRGYKDLLGGLGRVRSDFDPQSVHFLYARYERTALDPFDSVTGTFSFNSQQDGSARQGLKLTDALTEDRARVDVYGYAGQATTHIGRRQAVAFGGEIYAERISAQRLADEQPARPLYPDGSRYTTYGLFLQDAIELGHGLRASAGTRLTAIRFRAKADPGFGVAATSQTFHDLTFHTSLQWQATRILAFHGIVSRGFRAPNLNDLGAIGLNDLGYEIPAAEAIPAGALLSTSAGEGALSSGKRLESLGPERLYNYEFGIRLQTNRLYARAHVFDSELLSPIVRRTLLFPADRIPSTLAGLPVTPIQQTPGQMQQGVVAVATPLDPRAVKAFVNDGHSRYYGVESLLRYKLTDRWSARANYTFLVGRDLNPNRFIRRLPPQQGFLGLRYTPSGRRPWLELGGTFTGPQERMSGGDLDDERMGASRRRRDIVDFFNGTVVSQYLDSDGRFTPTGETLPQILDRVLPIGATINGVRVVDDNTRVPLYTRTAGWVSLDLRGGAPLDERLQLNFAVMNLLDRNYRWHGSGIDAPGINAWIGIQYRF